MTQNRFGYAFNIECKETGKLYFPIGMQLPNYSK